MALNDPDANIDPVLRNEVVAPAPPTSVQSPARNPDGSIVGQEIYEALLHAIKKKDTLRAACTALGLKHPKSANLERLRAILVTHWYPPPVAGVVSPTTPRRPCGQGRRVASSSPASSVHPDDVDIEDDETLLDQYDVEGAHAQDLLGYDQDGLDEEDEDEDLDEEDTLDLDDDDNFRKYQTTVRVDAAKRSENNRRAGGRKTQKSIVKSWNLFLAEAKRKGQVKDDIVDEHSLLVYINHLAERPKRNRRGEPIVGTRIGASQIKKEFFGALRIRKVQDAHDPTLAIKRPATTVHVYDAVKARMNEALTRARLGLIPSEDAPDIIANTFLAQVTDEQLRDIGFGFLKHRELRATINGHLAWTLQNGSGNRGDDVRALKLCEMQPYTWLHPNGETAVYSVLGLQSEEKAGGRGMKSTVNPTYKCWIAHSNPILCPLGALALYYHFLYDHYKLEDKLAVQWSQNKSWRQVRLIFGSSPTTAYNESNLYNLYCQAYKKANFASGIKAHLPRHQLGYQQERMGVDSHSTAKLGWKHDTYHDVYAPQLPKTASCSTAGYAILGCHGYKAHEVYDPIWRKVPVPSQFLIQMCPMAEKIIAKVEGQANLVGTTKFWEMVVTLRPFMFQCAAALFEVVPQSSLFRLPALVLPEVRQWMKVEFQTQLTLLKAQAQNPVDLERLQNVLLRQSLEQMRVLLKEQTDQLRLLTDLLQRRTAVLSPAKAYSHASYARSVDPTSLSFVDPTGSHASSTSTFPLGSPIVLSTSSPARLDPPSTIDTETRAHEDTGIYEAQDNSLRAFIAPSPASPAAPRPRTQVDLVLPPTKAFCRPGEAQLVWPPVLGQGSVTWPEVFHLIKQPEYLWDVWKPRSLEQMDLETIWTCYNIGEAVVDANGDPTGMKPPLRLVEQTFQASWRNTPAARKAWQRFREIPEWIENAIRNRGLCPADAIVQLEDLRQVDSSTALLGMSALCNKLSKQRKALAAHAGSIKASNSEQEASNGEQGSSVLEPAPAITASGLKRRAPTIGGRTKPKKIKK
ncbi:hypothetical protein B0H21DRAFT_812429 [Amylocystis lapponica]|nr:hypothetical protein B0H21DRAFT_812429 [Amylocystis lapponica]